ncbi:dodecin domain-containing protein [Bradyrhizobium sp. 192]|uniref:dodecin family protein n=1 Tax=Bradyrhizobium sp. 192 TaxID=2782660 RepID=UPI0023EEDBCF|nr:dodecin domain-containing protein [Bradyrhizobium sp. 192]
MLDSVYKVIELVGTSTDLWEKAAANAVEQAAKSHRDLRIAEVVKLDMQLDDKGKVEAYRTKLNVSFKFEGTRASSTSPYGRGWLIGKHALRGPPNRPLWPIPEVALVRLGPICSGAGSVWRVVDPCTWSFANTRMFVR